MTSYESIYNHQNMFVLYIQNLGVTADLACYNILLKACCLAGRVDLAQDIYREVQHLESTGVLKLDVFTYSTIVKVHINLLTCYYISALA